MQFRGIITNGNSAISPTTVLVEYMPIRSHVIAYIKILCLFFRIMIISLSGEISHNKMLFTGSLVNNR